ncbi:saccharopine dehydrogenase [Vreelandella nigrificans]|uniref:Saccharopine dehydrogenase n=1 Tax=Vreelandella nigrificans TaxID=2042704 RepID=A0A2A4HGF0_9GAMM|nr:saccharopine dehydrogenase [Halomonas nigrificans]PCF93902.1 saccharopine dehydrogenase [Halomonas nigrificans]
MTSLQSASVLLLGGYGSLGSRVARLLRRRHPGLHLTIAGRNREKAGALATELGNADAALVDLSRADLGLPQDRPFSAVVTAVRDLSLNSMRFAQDRGIAYVALSDAPFELGPLVARYIHEPTASVLMLGHSIGAVPTLAALHFAGRFSRVEAIEIGLVFDPDDPFGAMSNADMARIAQVGPQPLLMREGRWSYAAGEEAARTFTGVGGARHQGQAVGLADLLSLSSIETVNSLRLDVAEGLTASSRSGRGPSHEVIIEISGELVGGDTGRYRYELVDPQGYAMLSARGVAVCVERLLGLNGGAPPGPGLYLPESLVDPAYLLEQVEAGGVTVNRSEV